MKPNTCALLEAMKNDTSVPMNINASIGLTKKDANKEFYWMFIPNAMKLAKQYYPGIYKKMILSTKLDTLNTMDQKKLQPLKFSI